MKSTQAERGGPGRAWSFLLLSFAAALALTAAPPTKLTVHVVSAVSGKPVDRASVIVKFREGIGVNLKKIITSWETKTNQDGMVTLPTMPQGKVQVQIIAPNYQTFGDIFVTDKPEQTIEIKLNPPQPQYSEDSKTTTVPK
jgi:5-hydroxyisourate hydrolase-like protein (transthyretin family)